MTPSSKTPAKRASKTKYAVPAVEHLAQNHRGYGITELARELGISTNGVIRFYLDGKPAGSKPFDLGIPLDLTAYRLGAWKAWETKPANNFHGTLDDMRVYRGTLTDTEVASLAQAGNHRSQTSAKSNAR